MSNVLLSYYAMRNKKKQFYLTHVTLCFEQFHASKFFVGVKCHDTNSLLITTNKIEKSILVAKLFEPSVLFCIQEKNIIIQIINTKKVHWTDMSSSSLHELWSKACDNEKINREISKRWLDTVETKYNTESHRFYHNANILYKKCDFLQSINSTSVKISDYLIFATVFQYFHFDLKSECSEKNRDTFRQFYKEAGIDDVSICY